MLAFFEEELGISKKYFDWNLIAEYKTHEWDGTPNPILKMCKSIEGGKWTAVEGGTGTSKAQPIDAIVATTRGWVKIKDLSLSDMVYGSDGLPHKLTGIYYYDEQEIARVTFSDGTSTTTSLNHYWTIESRKRFDRKPITVQTADLHKYLKWSLPEYQPLDYPAKIFEIDPYVLGCILGDGTLRGGGLRITSADKELIDELNRRLMPGHNVHKLESATNKYDYTISSITPNITSSGLRAKLAIVGLTDQYSHDKFIPDQYLFGSIQQRYDLLRGLMDTDGTIDKRTNSSSFTTTSVRLADDIATLVRSLGGHAKITKSVNRYYVYNNKKTPCRDSFHVGINTSQCPFLLKRKANHWKSPTNNHLRRIISVEKIGYSEVACISTSSPDQLYFTNDYILTHNTFTAACIALWFLRCFDNSIVVTTAPKEQQLELHIWKEISKLKTKFAFGELGKLRLRMKEDSDEWLMIGFVAGVKSSEQEMSATKAQGFHAEHLLFIFEETPGISQAILNAFMNTCVAPHNVILALGNPDHQLDTLHKFSKLEHVEPIRISGFDCPNVVLNNPSFIPGGQTREGLKRMENIYHGKDSPLYLSRARGISPEQSTDSLIRLEWIREAQKRERPEQNGLPSLGCDVANSTNGDEAAIAYGLGSVLLSLESEPCPNANRFGEKIFLMMKEKQINPEFVGVDGVGVGAGAVNELKRLDAYVYDIQSGSKALELMKNGIELSETFNNLRSQMWWQARMDFQDEKSDLCIAIEDEELVADLISPKFKIEGGKIKVESKDEIRKRLGRSPNKGDAFVYWNWVRTHRIEQDTFAFAT